MLGYSSCKHQDWFDENYAEISVFLNDKNLVDTAKLRNPASAEHYSNGNWSQLRSHVETCLRAMEYIYHSGQPAQTLRESKVLTLGEIQYFVWDTASQSTK